MAVTLEDLRAIYGDGPSDDALQTALDAALEAIEAMYGADGDVTEHLRPFGQWLKLTRRTEDVSEVIEGTTTLDASDYLIWPGGRYLRRLTSDEPAAWLDWVDVTYTPASEAASRDRVAIALVGLDVTNPAGLTSITVGPWSEHYAAGGEGYASGRDALLRSLRSAEMGTR